VGFNHSPQEMTEISEKIAERAEELGMARGEVTAQIEAFGELQKGMELFDPDRIDELVELIVLWQEITGANNISEALSEEEIRENMELAAEIRDKYNLPVDRSGKGDA